MLRLRTYRKLQRRGIFKSMTRFLSILGIVLIGTGFLAGLLATAPDMKLTVDRYYAENRFMDIDIKGTLGLTDADADALCELDWVETVMPARVADVIMDCSNGSSYVVRLAGSDLERRGTDAFLNDFRLVRGRMPAHPDEVIAVELSKFSEIHHEVGEIFKISPQNPDYEERDDTYREQTFRIVGIAETPQYMTTETEPSTVGTGHVELVFFGDIDAFSLDVYTDLYIRVRGADDLNCFEDTYCERIDEVEGALESLGTERSILRTDEVRSEAQEKIDDAWDEFNDAKADAEESLSDARDTLDDAGKELADAREKLDDGRKEYDKAHYEFYKQKGIAEKAFEDGKQQLQQALAAGLIPEEMYRAELEKAEKSYDEAMATFTREHRKLADAKQELLDGAQEILDAEKELEDAERDYADARERTDRELSDAEKKITDAQEELDDLDDAEWIITDRRDSVSYYSYKSNTEKVDAVAKVFPIFLFLVAALVALTTMTRMVEEERTQVGTLKALGYSDGEILSYYIIYCVLATLSGSVLGVWIGFRVLPSVISEAYGMMYTIPKIVTVFRWDIVAVIVPVAILSTLAATLWACLSTLREKPARLMLPKAPKAGKRIFLEYIGFLWRPMRFTRKVTFRNIFRYKKRLYMTVIGIAGCTALLLTGFGLKDSINDILSKQFGELYHYDMTVMLSDGDALEKSPEIREYLDTAGTIGAYMEAHSETGTVTANGKKQETSIYVPRDIERMPALISLRERNKEHTPIPFGESDVVLTEKMCEQLGLKKGDTFTLTDDEGNEATLSVAGITENYVTSYTFISASMYEKCFSREPEFDHILAAYADKSIDEGTISAALLRYDDVLLVQFNSSVRTSFDNLIGNINYIVYVLIIAAGALAMIVLYNLTNINVSERKKELATIKVLGFYEPEVARYIYRETNALSFIGMLVGFVFGIWLHAFVIHTAEVDAVMFGRTLYPKSYVLAGAITILFTLFVDLIMLPKIRGISMVESMKANE